MREPITGALQISDRLLSVMLGTATGKLPTGAALRNGVSFQNGPPASAVQEEPKTGRDYYEVWKGLSQVAQERAKACTARYEEASARVIALEDRKNQCYAMGDSLRDQYEQLTAKQAGLNTRIDKTDEAIVKVKNELAELDEKIKSLEAERETLRILRYIPIVNLFSELVAAIKGTYADLDCKRNEFNDWEARLNGLKVEQRQIEEEASFTRQQMLEKQREAKQLEEMQDFYQKLRDKASMEEIEWKDRERYYLQLVDEMEHLIAIEADVEDFKKLIADNPPPFELAA